MQRSESVEAESTHLGDTKKKKKHISVSHKWLKLISINENEKTLYFSFNPPTEYVENKQNGVNKIKPNTYFSCQLNQQFKRNRIKEVVLASTNFTKVEKKIFRMDIPEGMIKFTFTGPIEIDGEKYYDQDSDRDPVKWEVSLRTFLMLAKQGYGAPSKDEINEAVVKATRYINKKGKNSTNDNLDQAQIGDPNVIATITTTTTTTTTVSLNYPSVSAPSVASPSPDTQKKDLLFELAKLAEEELDKFKKPSEGCLLLTPVSTTLSLQQKDAPILSLPSSSNDVQMSNPQQNISKKHKRVSVGQSSELWNKPKTPTLSNPPPSNDLSQAQQVEELIKEFNQKRLKS